MDQPPARWVNPLEFDSWDLLVQKHARSSFFHTAAWANVLQRTYGHRPFYFVEFANSEISSLLPVVEVSSRVTGRRGVSLPFSDFCPLLTTRSAAQNLYEEGLNLGRERQWRYFESRNDGLRSDKPQALVTFDLHVLELNADTSHLYRNLAGATRRGIRKAEQAGVTVSFSSDMKAVCDFYSLHCLTRRKHGVPPQPFKFFENIWHYVIRPGHGFVAHATLEKQVVASALFFKHGAEAIYKFGASDYRFQQARANNLMMWEAVKRCVEIGCDTLHMGRTSLGQEGLRRFKLGFGAQERKIHYYRYDFKSGAFVAGRDNARTWVTHAFRLLPPALFRWVGQVLYPHLS